MHAFARFALLLSTFASLGCSDRPPTVPTARDAGPPPVCEGSFSTTVCIGELAWSCDADGYPSTSDDCAARGLACVEGEGCRVCAPRTVRCDGETVEVCNESGQAWLRGETCDTAAGERCSDRGCADLCARAAEERSYLGCEYWPVTTRNSPIGQDFSFAVIAANPQLVPAELVVYRGETELTRRTLAPGTLDTITLPWVEALWHPAGTVSVRVDDGAYRVTSDVPVVLSQFNPLEYAVPRDCAMGESGSLARDGRCNSFSNDASLLLPSHVLTGSYIVASRPTFFLRNGATPWINAPGFVALIGTAPDPVTIEVTPSAFIAGSTDGTVPAMMPGVPQTLTILRGEVIQLASAGADECPGTVRTETVGGTALGYCDPGRDYDLTGTVLRASGPIGVISGHDCTFVPFDRWACDHLEEQLFPVESLGTSAFVAPTHALRREPNLLRVISAADDNVVTFTPEIAGPFLLDRGEMRELELRAGVRVQGTGPILVATFLVGQDYNGLGSAGAGGLGDPSMALAIPDAQYRDEYAFFSPSSYAQSWIDVIAPDGVRVAMDRSVVTGWRPIEGTGWSTASMQVEPGVHRISASRVFGLQVYGFGSYTSYLVTGGLDFRPITPPF